MSPMPDARPEPLDEVETERFETERDRLVGLAYRMLGSIADAEDVVQAGWLRWSDPDRGPVDRPAAWLTTVVSRLAIDRMRQQQRRREDYVGPWLPEPVATQPADPGSVGVDPARAAELADSVTFGFLVLLDRLSPVERAVFVLAEVFGEPFPAIAAAVGKSPDAVRQIATRARRKVRDGRTEQRPADATLLTELVAALGEGSVDKVLSLMSPDVVLTSDGGPKRRAARRPVVGADRVSRLMVHLTSRVVDDVEVSLTELNGAAAYVIRAEGLHMVLAADAGVDGRIAAVHIVMNPDKLGGVDRSEPVP